MGEATGFNRQEAEHSVETFARAMCMLAGVAIPGVDRMGSIITQAVGSMSLHELRNLGAVSGDTIARIGQLISSVTESGAPRNLHGAEAARAFQQAGQVGTGGVGTFARWAAQHGFSPSDARETSNEGGGSSGGGGRGSAGSSYRYVEAMRASDDAARALANPVSGSVYASPAQYAAYAQHGVGRAEAGQMMSYGMTGAAYGDLYRNGQGYSRDQIRQTVDYAGSM